MYIVVSSTIYFYFSKNIFFSGAYTLHCKHGNTARNQLYFSSNFMPKNGFVKYIGYSAPANSYGLNSFTINY